MISEMRLYARTGKRLYLNAAERQRFRQCALRHPPRDALLCLLLLHTGCRLSEALALTDLSFQRSGLSVAIVTLKRRKQGVVREVPVPLEVFTALRKCAVGRGQRLIEWHRATAWRRVCAVLDEAGVLGTQAMPKGLRHGFGVNAVRCGVPLNLLAKWMGHADIKTTAIYANATGPEERSIAAKMWGDLGSVTVKCRSG